MKRKLIDQLSVDNLKINALALITKAKNGNPTVTISSAKIFHALFFYHLKFDLENPNWIARDRVVISSKEHLHLYYATLKILGKISEKEFENSCNENIVTFDKKTGFDFLPTSYGQNIGYAAGLAIAQSNIAKKYPEANHFTYVICTKSDIETGAAQEALEYIGLNCLENLIVLYDSNSIKAANLNSYQDNQKKYEALNFKYFLIKDANAKAIAKIISIAKKTKKPCFIEIKTSIQEGIYKEELASNKTKFLSKNTLEEIKEKSYFQKTNMFDSYPEVIEAYKEVFEKNHKKFSHWTNSDELTNFLNDEIKENTNDLKLKNNCSYLEASYSIINNLASKYENIFVASTELNSLANIHYLNGIYAANNLIARGLLTGKRELALTNIACGLAAHSNIRPFVFLATEYAHLAIQSIKLALALNLKIAFIISNENFGINSSINLNVDQLAALRTISDFEILRPCDENELRGAFEYYLNNTNKSVLIEVNQKIMPKFEETSKSNFKTGAYYLWENKENTHTIISSGADLEVIYEFAKRYKISLISASNINNLRFLKYDKNFAISFENQSTFGWSKYARFNIGINKFKYSANKNDLNYLTNLNIELIHNKILSIIEKAKK